jgi:hypothetical protein
VTERPAEETRDFIDDGPGADPGAAYERAVEEGAVEEERETGDGPGLDEAFRSGS